MARAAIPPPAAWARSATPSTPRRAPARSANRRSSTRRSSNSPGSPPAAPNRCSISTPTPTTMTICAAPTRPSPCSAYTATFGSGFSATLSAEDQASRRAAIGSTITARPMTAGTAVVPVTINGITATSFLGQPAGSRIPDIVGSFRYDQPWGAVQISAAAHQNNASLFGTSALATPPVTPRAAVDPRLCLPGRHQQQLRLRGPGRHSAERRLSLARRQALAAGRL